MLAKSVLEGWGVSKKRFGTLEVLAKSCPWRGNRFARATLAYARAQELVEVATENLMEEQLKIHTSALP